MYIAKNPDSDAAKKRAAFAVKEEEVVKEKDDKMKVGDYKKAIETQQKLDPRLKKDKEKEIDFKVGEMYTRGDQRFQYQADNTFKRIT